jgi:hypothetical protein
MKNSIKTESRGKRRQIERCSKGCDLDIVDSKPKKQTDENKF